VVDNAENALAIFENEAIESGDVTCLDTMDDLHVRIGLQLALRRRDERLRAEDFDGVHHNRIESRQAQRCKRKFNQW
jgi:hypothetical protein